MAPELSVITLVDVFAVKSESNSLIPFKNTVKLPGDNATVCPFTSATPPPNSV